jgi:predicted amidophosphoribosyltransferase
LWGARGVLPFGADSAPTVWIADESAYDRACTLIRNHQSEPTHCGHCGYDLTGLPEPRCPECGRPFLRRAKREDWTCPGCGETIEGQFTECWSCGHEAPATEGEP